MKQDLVNLHHARSKHVFPNLKLEEDEFVELAFRRTRVGLILIWGGMIIGGLVLTLALVLFGASNRANIDLNAQRYVTILLFALYIVLFAIGLVMTKVYNGNSIYITNRRIIQIEMTSLFSKSTNVIDLISIEDVSFKQAGLMQYTFKYGTLRMATVGNETTYTFRFLDKPTDELSTITHLIHVQKEKNNSVKKSE